MGETLHVPVSTKNYDLVAGAAACAGGATLPARGCGKVHPPQTTRGDDVVFDSSTCHTASRALPLAATMQAGMFCRTGVGRGMDGSVSDVQAVLISCTGVGRGAAIMDGSTSRT